MSAEAKFAFYCQCGAAMTGAVEPASTVAELEAVFLSVHSGSGHGPATQREAANARRRSERRSAR